MLLRLAYLGVTNAFAMLRLLPMSNRDKDVEILALRHQIAVLQHQLGERKVAFEPADRALLAALLHRLPIEVLSRVRPLVRPDTVLRSPPATNSPHCSQCASESPAPITPIRWTSESTRLLDKPSSTMTIYCRRKRWSAIDLAGTSMNTNDRQIEDRWWGSNPGAWQPCRRRLNPVPVATGEIGPPDDREVLNVEDWAEIRRLHRAEGLPIRAISRQLGVGRNTVRRALAAQAPPKYRRAAKGSAVDPVEPQIRDLLAQWPTMPATVIAERIGCTPGG